MRYPVRIQADNSDARDGAAPCMCHVFDVAGETMMYQALQKQYLHVVAWDASGAEIFCYDNR